MKHSAFDIAEDLTVMSVALLLLAVLLFRTKSLYWTGKNKIQLGIASICFALDTICWRRGIHFPATDIYFWIVREKMKLTVFFVLSLVSFISLARDRLVRSQHLLK